jgi:hypothetical protein
MAVTWPLGFYVRVQIAEHKLAPLIGAAENYKAKNGRCPMNIEDIGSEHTTGWKDVSGWNYVSLGGGGGIVLYDRSLLLGSTIANYLCAPDGTFEVSFPTFTSWIRRGYSSRSQRWKF